MKDNLSIGGTAEIVNKSKSVVHGILKVYNDYGSSEARKSTFFMKLCRSEHHRCHCIYIYVYICTCK